jgi:hypothetical protein
MYGTTWKDLGRTPPHVAWQMLRALHHRPPGRARSGERRETFDAALEQSEQLLTAASMVGVQARPLLVFYGLAQAGRAIAAAAADARGNDWRLSGHGITAKAMEAADSNGVASVTVQNKGRGAYGTLAALLEAGTLVSPTPLGNIWGMLLEARRFPLPGSQGFVPLTVSVTRSWIVATDTVRATIGPLPAAIMAPALDSEPKENAGNRDWQGERRAVRELLAHYPRLAGARLISPEGNPVGLQKTGPDSAQAEVDLPSHNLAPDARSWYAFPALVDGESPQHPFMVWWAVTFALSMVARYEPRVWSNVVSVAHSADAAAVEHLLSEALVVLPELIHRTLIEVTD